MCLRSNSQFALSNKTFRIFKVSKKEKKDSLIKIIRNISSIVFHFQMQDSPMLIILLSEILKSFLPRIRKRWLSSYFSIIFRQRKRQKFRAFPIGNAILLQHRAFFRIFCVNLVATLINDVLQSVH